jgi:hypothetical protein
VRLDWAFPCRYAEPAADGTATIVGAQHVLAWADDVPGRVEVSLMLRLAAPVDDFDEEHRFEVRLVDPEREEVQMLSVDLGPFAEPRVAHPGLEADALLATRFEWEAEEFGLYTFELYVDDRRQRSLPFVVLDASEPSDAT